MSKSAPVGFHLLSRRTTTGPDLPRTTFDWESTPIISGTSSHPNPPQSQAPSPGGDKSNLEEDDEDLDLLIHFDSLKTNLQYEDKCLDDAEQLEDEELEEWEGFSSEDLANAMFEMLVADDPSDLDWLPEKRKTQREKRIKSQKGEYSPIQSHMETYLV